MIKLFKGSALLLMLTLNSQSFATVPSKFSPSPCPLNLITAQSQEPRGGQPRAATAPPAPPPPRNEIRIEDRDGKKEWNWQQQKDGKKTSAQILGEIRFTEDYADIQSISHGGHFQVEERRGANVRRYDVRPDDQGSLSRQYFVDGEAKAPDAEARQWAAGLILNLVRQSALEAPARVQSLLHRGGASAVLDEIARINNDYAKGRYFEELVKNGKLDKAALLQVNQSLNREIKSDYYKAQVLTLFPEGYLNERAALASFFEGVATIQSDYYHGRVIDAVLKNKSLDREILAATLKSVSRISSDYEKSRLLLQIVTATKEDSLSAAVSDTANTISSQYERNRVLAALVNRESRD